MPRFPLAAALCLFPLAANAAGFDCARAGTPPEKAICADQELSALDDRLAAAYRGARQRMGNTADMLVEGQRDWLRSLSPILAGKEGVVGVKAAYTERIAELDAITFPEAGQPEALPEIAITSPPGFALSLRQTAACPPESSGYTCIAPAQVLVRVAGESKLLQTLNIPELPIPCPGKTKCKPDDESERDRFNFYPVADYNFDGKPDFAIANQLPAAYRASGAFVFLFDPAARRFVYNQKLSDLTRRLTFELDPARKRIVVADKSGVSYRSEEIYRMEGLTVVPVSRRIEEDIQKGNRVVQKITESKGDGTRWISKTRYE